MLWREIGAMAWAALKAAVTGGSPFAMHSVLFPTNEEGKYVIASEGIRLAFTTHGGALTNLWVNDTNGVERDVVLGFDHADDYPAYKANPFLNGIIGRYAGVISGASFDVEGVHYETSPNGNGGSFTYNGGEKGWGRRKLDVASHSENSITFVVFDRAWSGFPGNPASCITHTVTPNEWHIAIGLTPVKFWSPINLSQQVFFNLDGFASETNRTIAHHKLRLPYSGLRFEVDHNGIPTGDLKSNAKGSQYDFWSGDKVIGESLERRQQVSPAGLDETFMIARGAAASANSGRGHREPAATLSSDLSGIKVELYTDQGALHVHSWNSQTDTLKLKRNQGGNPVPELAALSMEMHNWPDAVNHPEWQREKETIWGPDGLYTMFSTFRFSTNNKKVARS